MTTVQPVSTKKPNNRITAMNLFLTYTNCDLKPTLALELLTPLLSKIKNYIIFQKENSNGGVDLHVFIECFAKNSIKNISTLTLEHNGVHYLANLNTFTSKKKEVFSTLHNALNIITSDMIVPEMINYKLSNLSSFYRKMVSPELTTAIKIGDFNKALLLTEVNSLPSFVELYKNFIMALKLASGKNN